MKKEGRVAYRKGNKKLEAPSGFEPLNRSFADCSLNHLGTAPLEKSFYQIQA